MLLDAFFRNHHGPDPHPAIVTATGRSRRRVAIYALLVAGPFVAWVAVTTRTAGPGTQLRAIDRVDPGPGATLTVVWAADGCEQVDPAHTDVVERTDDVAIALRVTPAAGTDGRCDGGRREHVVQLDSPLGDRPVYDGACAIDRSGDRDCSVQVPVGR